MYVAIVAIAVSVIFAALWCAGVSPLAISGNVVQVPLSGTYVVAAADGLDVFRLGYSPVGIYVYSSAYNSSVVLAGEGQVGYLVYPAWNKRVTLTWTRTGETYAYVRISVT